MQVDEFNTEICYHYTIDGSLMDHLHRVCVDETMTVEISGRGKQRDTDRSSKPDNPAQKGQDGSGNRQQSHAGDKSRSEKPAADASKAAGGGSKEPDSSRKDEKDTRTGRDRDSDRSTRSARGTGDVQVVKGGRLSI